ncbi:sensor histidine kinase [Halohasta litorea]|uniref:histidine kinase n=1 Tax=Halohasta litorea TaxID=869891 RepID=A0ABD6D931_9EURY|nr:HAMP domain-containing sensor histidine kinase [Halohasta litorea]MEA1932677.1 HAMP domain-containing sensor histidine kinase [Euryarchaeota archaeon]
MRRRLSAGTIAGVGIATASLTLLFIINSEPTSGVVFVTDAIVPLLFSALLVGASYWAWADRSADTAMVRLTLWCLAGGAIVGGFEFLTLYSQFEGGVLIQKELQTLNAGVARGSVIGLAFGFYDVERQRTRRRERQLERQVERLEEFASIVSHDLRSPLTVARGRMELLEATHDLDAEHVDQIEFAHERMTEIIEDSLALARGGHEVTDPEAVDLESAAETAWQTAGSDSARLVVDEGTVEADEDRVTRLLENLFRNSVEHGLSTDHDTDGESAAEEPELTITVGQLPGKSGFYVADDGVGIPAEDRESIFEAGETNGGSGSGLGLAIVRRIAQAHGWTVELTESEAGGARFEFRT